MVIAIFVIRLYNQNMDANNSYTTIRVTRQTRWDMERIAEKHWKKTGEKLDAGQVAEKIVQFFLEQVFPEEKAQAEP